MISAMCSMPIWVALSFIGAYPSPISLVGLRIASVGKLGVGLRTFLVALFRILSIVSICLSVKMPRWVAWYLIWVVVRSLDFCGWVIVAFSLGPWPAFLCLMGCVWGDLGSLAWDWCVLQASCMIDWGGKYLMSVPSSNLIVEIWFYSRFVFLYSWGSHIPIVPLWPRILSFQVQGPCIC